ncbi:MAG: hypothetical protein ABH986_06850 [archaeon]
MKKNKFEKAYDLTKNNLGCPENCVICEDPAVMLLPGEAEFLSKKFSVPKESIANRHKINGHTVWMIAAEENHCNFFKCGKCINRDIRCLDCRSYPVIPFLEKDRLSVRLDKKCPLVKENKISAEFQENCLKAWKLVNPPKWWLKAYKKVCPE